MASRQISDDGARWERMSDLIVATLGLDFPPEKRIDLQRSMAGVATDLGFDDDVEGCVQSLLSSSPTRDQLQVLATHLTIGETYFFREKHTFDVLARTVLPALVHVRRGREQRLRLWSAACSTGEEPYSLAILMHQLLPDLANWQVTILATDVNGRALRKAAAGVYGEWSFRDAPAGFKERYFTRTASGHHAVRSEIKQLVTFEHLNLVEDIYPSLTTDTNAMDLIFCRNVLMYFAPAQISKVVGHLHCALMVGGWLAVSPSECSQTLFSQFATRNFPGVILYQKSDPPPITTALPTPLALPGAADWRSTAPLPARGPVARSASKGQPVQPVQPPPTHAAAARASVLSAAASFYEQGRHGEAADMLLAVAAESMLEPQACSLLARALANQGRLADALAWCDRWIAADKLSAAGHYLRAIVLLEQGQADTARLALQRTLYLDPTFVLAHFASGTLARAGGRHDEAARHFANTVHLLNRLQPADVLPESDGLTVDRLREMVTTLGDGPARSGQTRLREGVW